MIAHTGYHKAASTLLQEKVFQPQFGFSAPRPIRFHFDTIVRSNPYTDRVGHLREAYAPDIERAAAEGLVPVITHEALMGNPFDGGNQYGTTTYAEQLIEAFPDVTVVVVVREQASMLTSLYKHSVAGYRTWDLDTFLPDEHVRGAFALEFLEYSWPLLRLRSLLGPERLKVMPYEMLISTPAAFLQTFEELGGRRIPPETVAGDRVNSGLTALEADLKRFGNRALPSAPGNRAWLNGHVHRATRVTARAMGRRVASRHDQKLRAHILSRIEGRYNASNAALSAAFDLDLEALGYQV